MRVPSGRVEFDPGEWKFLSLARMGEWGSILSVYTAGCPAWNEARWPIASSGACIINIYVYSWLNIPWVLIEVIQYLYMRLCLQSESSYNPNCLHWSKLLPVLANLWSQSCILIIISPNLETRCVHRCNTSWQSSRKTCISSKVFNFVLLSLVIGCFNTWPMKCCKNKFLKHRKIDFKKKMIFHCFFFCIYDIEYQPIWILLKEKA